MSPSWLANWPLIQQLRGADPSGPASMTQRTRTLHARTSGTKTARSVCPYCAVGCGQLVHHRDDKLVAIEGDPESIVSGGALCPKGAASHQLLTHEGRLTTILHRAPGARTWTQVPLEAAMDRIAELVWNSRRTRWVEEEDGHAVGHTTNIAHLGGATLDNEENYLIKKLFTGGLGIVPVSNQARI